MNTLGYVLVAVGMMLSLGGVVSVFNFDQPADTFSWAWWMIVGGWSMALTGMGADILQLFRINKRESVYVSQTHMKQTSTEESEITRV